METYKVRVKVEIVPCTESPTHEPVKHEDGSFQITLAEPEAMSIDTCERALLQTAYPTLREALSTHLSAVSKKSPCANDRRQSGDEFLDVSGGWRGWAVRICDASDSSCEQAGL
jgi:hypothetical protein